MTKHIDPEGIKAVLLSSLFAPDEITTPGVVPKNAIIVRGITKTFGFHPDRLESHRTQVREWLELLPHKFRKSGGGGWSFLNACNEDTGEQWGEHRDMEHLFCLAIGLGLAKWVAPRDMWGVFPGGMPYVVILI